MIANDVVVNFRNATSEPLTFGFFRPIVKRVVYLPIEPGKESGFAAGLEPSSLAARSFLYLRYPGAQEFSYRIYCKNPEIGSPSATIGWRPPGVNATLKDLSGDRDMGENTTFEITHLGYRFHVHRWSNGKEPLDDYDEWYTRFFVTMSNA